jgi:hypothetical protein
VDQDWRERSSVGLRAWVERADAHPALILPQTAVNGTDAELQRALDGISRQLGTR